MDFENLINKLEREFSPSTHQKIGRKNSAASINKQKPKSQMQIAYIEKQYRSPIRSRRSIASQYDYATSVQTNMLLDINRKIKESKKSKNPTNYQSDDNGQQRSRLSLIAQRNFFNKSKTPAFNKGKRTDIQVLRKPFQQNQQTPNLSPSIPQRELIRGKRNSMFNIIVDKDQNNIQRTTQIYTIQPERQYQTQTPNTAEKNKQHIKKRRQFLDGSMSLNDIWTMLQNAQTVSFTPNPEKDNNDEEQREDEIVSNMILQQSKKRILNQQTSRKQLLETIPEFDDLLTKESFAQNIGVNQQT